MTLAWEVEEEVMWYKLHPKEMSRLGLVWVSNYWELHTMVSKHLSSISAIVSQYLLLDNDAKNCHKVIWMKFLF